MAISAFVGHGKLGLCTEHGEARQVYSRNICGKHVGTYRGHFWKPRFANSSSHVCYFDLLLSTTTENVIELRYQVT